MDELDYNEENTNVMFLFERGAFFSGEIEYRIIDMHFSMEGYNSFYDMQRFEFDVTNEDLYKIGKILEPVKAWEREYDNEEEVYDGFGWSIAYHYEGTDIASEGYEAFPDDYAKVIAELQEYMETLCKKYAADNYKEDEAARRREL